jgi:hypothetical protein
VGDYVLGNLLTSVVERIISYVRVPTRGVIYLNEVTVRRLDRS